MLMPARPVYSEDAYVRRLSTGLVQTLCLAKYSGDMCNLCAAYRLPWPIRHCDCLFSSREAMKQRRRANDMWDVYVNRS